MQQTKWNALSRYKQPRDQLIKIFPVCNEWRFSCMDILETPLAKYVINNSPSRGYIKTEFNLNSVFQILFQSRYYFTPQHFLYFFPLPQEQGSFGLVFLRSGKITSDFSPSLSSMISTPSSSEKSTSLASLSPFDAPFRKGG
jgi:hypothetical protein